MALMNTFLEKVLLGIVVAASCDAQCNRRAANRDSHSRYPIACDQCRQFDFYVALANAVYLDGMVPQLDRLRAAAR